MSMNNDSSQPNMIDIIITLKLEQNKLHRICYAASQVMLDMQRQVDIIQSQLDMLAGITGVKVSPVEDNGNGTGERASFTPTGHDV
jgi:hypothetical protein